MGGGRVGLWRTHLEENNGRHARLTATHMRNSDLGLGHYPKTAMSTVSVPRLVHTRTMGLNISLFFVATTTFILVLSVFFILGVYV